VGGFETCRISGKTTYDCRKFVRNRKMKLLRDLPAGEDERILNGAQINEILKFYLCVVLDFYDDDGERYVSINS
jgi:hypothetical protein